VAFRRADAGRSDFSGSEEFRATLQRRLAVLNWWFAAFNVVAAALVLSSDSMRARTLESPFEVGSAIFYGIVAVADAFVAYGLRASRPRPIRTLRIVEFAAFGFATFVIAWLNVYDLNTLQGVYELAPIDITMGRMLYHVMLLVTYGTLVPNTARRTGIALLLMSAVALGIDLWALQTGRIPADIAGVVLTLKVAMLSLFGFVLWFGSYRLEVVARREAAARELGQYLLGERLGAGGMGEVFRAEHRLLRRPVAIKLITPEQAGSPDAIARFEREAQATAQLTHPNTVQVFDYGRADDGTFYCVMEYLPGRTLEQVVRDEGPMSPRRAIALLEQVCGALSEAHNAGLVHRDIKPSNVMLTERGGVRDVAKLLDFGLVVSRAASDGRVTEAGMFVGTPEYMSPEQCAGVDGDIGPASDIYALGAVAYFLLSGSSPFAGRSATQMLAAHFYETPPPPSARHAGVPGVLDALVLRALEKRGSDRFATATDFATALREADRTLAG